MHVDYDIATSLKLTSITNYAHMDMAVHFPLDGTRIDIIEGEAFRQHQDLWRRAACCPETSPTSACTRIVGVNYSKDEIHEEDEDYGFNNFFSDCSSRAFILTRVRHFTGEDVWPHLPTPIGK